MVDLVFEQEHLAHDAADASAAIQAVFGVGAVTVESVGSLRYEQRSLIDDGISATRISSAGAVVHVHAEPVPEMVAIAVRSGYAVLREGDQTVALQAGDLGLIPLEHTARASWERVEMDLYSFPRSSLGHLLGTDAEQLQLRVARLKAVSPTVTAVWLRTAALLSEEVLRDPELYGSDLIREQAIDSLLGLTIDAFGISDAHEDDTADDENKVQHATRYLLANLEKSVSVADVARAVGVSVGSLQLAYRRTGKGTPLAHLRALRMEAAHAALTRATSAAPAPPTVARNVGYRNIGRFDAHYRQAFGETPEETVRASQVRR